MLSCFPAGSEPADFNAQWVHLYLYGIRLIEQTADLTLHSYLQNPHCQFVPISKVSYNGQILAAWTAYSCLNEGRSY
jgi:hypothetical protein